MKLVWAFLAALLVSGCYYIYPASSPTLSQCKFANEDGEIVEHLFVENCGWYLFYTIPICCGDTDESHWFPLVFFDDQVTDEAIQRRFAERVKAKGARAVGVTMVNRETVTFDVPGLPFPVVVPYILCAREVQISGTLIRDAGEEKRDE